MAEAQYILTIRVKQSDVPAEVRLRRALKLMLRQYDLTATDIRQIAAVQVPDCGTGRTAERGHRQTSADFGGL